MSQANNDPYIGQYPPPQPLPSSDQNQERHQERDQERQSQQLAMPQPPFNSPPAAFNSNASYTHHDSIQSMPQPTFPMQPTPVHHHQAVANDYHTPHTSETHDEYRQSYPVTYEPQGHSTPGNTEYYDKSSYHTTQQESTAGYDNYFDNGHYHSAQQPPQSFEHRESFTVVPIDKNEYNDPQAVPLNEYVQPDPKNLESASHSHHSHYPDDDTQNELSDQTPMVQEGEPAKESKKAKVNKYERKPEPSDLEENKESYRAHKAQPTRQKRYMSCCGWCCLLISIIFLLAGVALMIASKVIRDKCSNQCDQLPEQAPASASDACGTLCNSVVHDGMLYGGAAVAGLAALVGLWQLCRYCCSGHRR